MWKALHIFYYDKQDQLLYEGVFPIMRKYNIKKFFFIRYWERGPHIRLRINIEENTLFEAIKKEIGMYVSLHRSIIRFSETQYINEAYRYAKKEEIDINTMDGLIPNNTVCEMKYIPEIDKYHGEKGVSIAEEEFCFSSFLALNIIGLYKSKSNKICFGAAYAMSLVDTVLREESEKILFYSYYRKYWERFSEMTEQYKKQLISNINNVNSEEIRKIEKTYNKYARDFHEKLFGKIGNNTKVIFDFLMNFIHLFNNRIGVLPYEEVMATLICEKIVKERI